ncbi:Post-GPI attachment to proteins factor 3 [Irineochytrium annulatum]|nr:Post-GPI attachment to proteins factor 3 [Irineochytrium annulatum]
MQLTITCLLLFNALATLASSGDRQSYYLNCVSKCKISKCRTPQPEPLPLTLRLTFWTCEQNCQYNCMHQTTVLNIASNDRVHQFHGKWPFTRFLGLQEPASVLFSILNCYAHYRGYRRLRDEVPRHAAFKRLYMLNALVATHGWIWSIIFHARDFSWTERMDYFSALASITFACYVAVVRATGIIHNNTARWRVGFLFGLFFACHVSYLTFWPFDYAYNMAAGVTVGMVSNVIWMSVAIRHLRERPFGWKMIVMVVCLTAAMSLELLDFPPIWWVFDAHALWHGATPPLIYLYHGYFVDDAIYEASRKGRHIL